MIHENIDEQIKEKRVNRAIILIKNGRMPVSNYLTFHEEARMTKAEKETLIAWFEEELVD